MGPLPQRTDKEWVMVLHAEIQKPDTLPLLSPCLVILIFLLLSIKINTLLHSLLVGLKHFFLPAFIISDMLSLTQYLACNLRKGAVQVKCVALTVGTF